MTIFGGSGSAARLYLPKATCRWSIEGLFDGMGSKSNVVLSSIDMNDVESIDVRRCFNETNHIFAFGRDVTKSVINVSVILFFGESCGGGSSVSEDGYSYGGAAVKLADIRSKYEKARVSKSKKSRMIQFDDFTVRGFLIGMQLGSMDARTSTCTVVFTFIPDQDDK